MSEYTSINRYELVVKEYNIGIYDKLEKTTIINCELNKSDDKSNIQDGLEGIVDLLNFKEMEIYSLKLKESVNGWI